MILSTLSVLTISSFLSIYSSVPLYIAYSCFSYSNLAFS